MSKNKLNLARNNPSFGQNDYSNQPFNSTPIIVVPPRPRRRSDDAIIHPPKHPVAFWNVHEQAISATAKTNNAMESAHFHFAVNKKFVINIKGIQKDLHFHPSMSEYLGAFWEDFEKQYDNKRSADKFKQKRHLKYVIREAEVMFTLQNARYENHQNIMDTLNLLAFQIQDYTGGLHYDGHYYDDEESPSEDDENDGTNDENSNPTEEFIRAIKRPISRSPASTINLDFPSTSSQSYTSI
jgi:hypothetical protein